LRIIPYPSADILPIFLSSFGVEKSSHQPIALDIRNHFRHIAVAFAPLFAPGARARRVQQLHELLRESRWRIEEVSLSPTALTWPRILALRDPVHNILRIQLTSLAKVAQLWSEKFPAEPLTLEDMRAIALCHELAHDQIETEEPFSSDHLALIAEEIACRWIAGRFWFIRNDPLWLDLLYQEYLSGL
ncbi:MAG: hypothetical protein V2A74_05965, partial [bacterium]